MSRSYTQEPAAFERQQLFLFTFLQPLAIYFALEFAPHINSHPIRRHDPPDPAAISCLLKRRDLPHCGLSPAPPADHHAEPDGALEYLRLPCVRLELCLRIGRQSASPSHPPVRRIA